MENLKNDFPSSRKQPRKGRILPILIGAVLAIVLVFFLTKYIFSDPDMVDVTTEKIDVAREKWNQNRPEDYRLKVQVQGPLTGIYEVKVVDHEVVSASFQERPFTDRRNLSTWSVPGMLRLLELDMATQKQLQEKGIRLMVRAEFDPRYGYPARYQRLDYSNRQSVSWSVIAFSTDADAADMPVDQTPYAILDNHTVAVRREPPGFDRNTPPKNRTARAVPLHFVTVVNSHLPIA